MLNAKIIIILREKDFGCGKFLWKATRKESFKEMKAFDLEFFIMQFPMTVEKLVNHLAMAAPRMMGISLRREALGPRERL